MGQLGKLFLLVGAAFVVLGILLLGGERVGLGRLGRLPGDFRFSRGGVHVVLPLGSALVVSAVLTLVATLVKLLWRR